MLKRILIITALLLIGWFGTNLDLPLYFAHMDKLYHCAGFTILAFLMTQLIEKPNKLNWILIIGTLLLFGIGDEVRQIYMPYRQASIFDLLFDTFGILNGCYVGKLLLTYQKGVAK